MLRPDVLLKNFQLIFLLLFVLVLMIQGWGDHLGLLMHPARAGLLAILAGSVLILLFVPCTLFASGAKEAPHQRWPTWLAIGVMGGLCWLLPYADRRNLLVWPESDTLLYVGLVCAGIGTSLRVGGMIQLGRLFSGFVVLQQQHTLITRGCYRWVRHPIYTGSLFAVLGFFLVFRSQLVVIVLPVYVAGTLWRIAAEEQLLAEHFGPVYEQYRARTWCLLPFIY
jgi:protein-S-isoprenylcysteine O-methyltransferase Ste14